MSLSLADLQRLSLVRIVDDDPELCRALTFFLKAEGWTSRSYEHPEAFVLGDNPEAPGCLILDLQMPGMTGTELQRLLKSKHNRIPIVFLSAHCDIDTAVLAVLDGAVDFIQTPVDEDRLVRAVEKACRLHQALLNNGVGEEQARSMVACLTDREASAAAMLVDELSTFRQTMNLPAKRRRSFELVGASSLRRRLLRNGLPSTLRNGLRSTETIG